MTLRSSVFTVATVLYSLLVSADAEYTIQCDQGQYLYNSQGRSICRPCPVDTYWAMRLDANSTVVGVICENCIPGYESPEGSPDATHCVCKDERCEPATADSSMGLILGVVITVVVLGVVIATLFWCKSYGPAFVDDLMKAISGRPIVVAQDNADDTLLHPTPSNLCDIEIDITPDQLDDPGYDDTTTQGDHNDMQAVLRAAVISEKRRSKIYSTYSMSSLDRQRTTSMNSQRSGTGAGYTGAGYEKFDNYNKGANLPVPDYRQFEHMNPQQQQMNPQYMNPQHNMNPHQMNLQPMNSYMNGAQPPQNPHLKAQTRL